MRKLAFILVACGGCKLPTASSSPLPKTAEERQAFVKQWAPIHERAVRVRATEILGCDAVVLELVGAGPLNTEDALDDRYTTSWRGEGCDRDGAWIAYCPPLPALGNPTPGPGQVACEVRQQGLLEKPGMARVVSDEGAVVILDVDAPSEEYPED